MAQVDQLTARITDIKGRIAFAEQQAAQAASLKALAVERVREVTEALASQFGVTPEQAPELLASLEAQLTDETAAIEAALEGAGL